MKLNGIQMSPICLQGQYCKSLNQIKCHLLVLDSLPLFAFRDNPFARTVEEKLFHVHSIAIDKASLDAIREDWSGRLLLYKSDTSMILQMSLITYN